MDDLDRRELAAVALGKELYGRFDAIAQDRTDFMLEHFVVGTHDTVERQWAQAVLELRTRCFAIERNRLELCRLELDIEDIRADDKLSDKRRQLALDLKAVELAEFELGRTSLVREAETLYAILRRLEQENGGPFTFEQIQAGEAEYWRLRLERQALTDLASMGTVSSGEREAIQQLLRPIGGSGVRRLKDEAFASFGHLPMADAPKMLKESKA